MIPVRVPADMKATRAVDRVFAPVATGHWLEETPCPVCDEPVGVLPSVLIFVGISPEDRKPAGWTTGAAVAVHQECAVTQ